MRKKELKTLLKESMITRIPDITSKIDLNQIVIEPKPAIYQISRTFALRLATVLVLAIMITVGVLSSRGGTTTLTPITLSAESTSSFTAVSSSVLLNAQTVESSISTGQILLSTDMRSNSVMMQDKLTRLNPYFNMIELFLVDDDLHFSEAVASDNPDYQYMMTYQMIDLAGVIQTYTYYFTETTSGDETVITGLLRLANIDYYLEGSKETSDESEIVTLKTYADPTRKSLDYVLTVSEKALDEQKFTYHVYVDGEQTEKSELKLESEGNTVKVKLKYENEALDEAIEIEAFRVEQNGRALLKVKYEIENNMMDESGEMMVFVEFNETTNVTEYRYEIKNSKGEMSESSGSRRNHDDDDDEDDEDETDDIDEADEEDEEDDDFPGPRN